MKKEFYLEINSYFLEGDIVLKGLLVIAVFAIY